MASLYSLFRPLIFVLPPECAHQFAISVLPCLPAANHTPAATLRTQVFGLQFASPLGLAAGFDKNAQVINAVLNQGFGFAEAGTVTPKAQPGNPRPRMFRLKEDEAVINRLGFNNHGLNYYCQNFTKRDKKLGIAGANIGKNKDSKDAAKDYIAGIEAVYAMADYITVNISSPNTKGLRDLQHANALDSLLSSLVVTRKECIIRHGRRVPLLLKIAPDLEGSQAKDIVALVKQYGIDGIIVSNTTLARPEHLKSRHAGEEGGLSGRPLFDISTATLQQVYALTAGSIPLVGVGGISCADTAYAKIKAGASLLQLYSALVYKGFGLVQQINEGLAQHLERDGFDSIQQAVGKDVA